ncbi:hypothetical protein SCOR_05135 [Sulfidibacter corallicola]
MPYNDVGEKAAPFCCSCALWVRVASESPSGRWTYLALPALHDDPLGLRLLRDWLPSKCSSGRWTYLALPALHDDPLGLRLLRDWLPSESPSGRWTYLALPALHDDPLGLRLLRDWLASKSRPSRPTYRHGPSFVHAGTPECLLAGRAGDRGHLGFAVGRAQSTQSGRWTYLALPALHDDPLGLRLLRDWLASKSRPSRLTAPDQPTAMAHLSCMRALLSVYWQGVPVIAGISGSPLGAPKAPTKPKTTFSPGRITRFQSRFDAVTAPGPLPSICAFHACSIRSRVNCQLTDQPVIGVSPLLVISTFATNPVFQTSWIT